VKKGRVSVLRICFTISRLAEIFLKSNGVEMSHITEEFQRIALANPSISFSLIQEDELVLDMPAAKLSQRIVNLFGKNYQTQLCSCSGRDIFTENYRLHWSTGTCQEKNVVNNSFS